MKSPCVRMSRALRSNLSARANCSLYARERELLEIFHSAAAETEYIYTYIYPPLFSHNTAHVLCAIHGCVQTFWVLVIQRGCVVGVNHPLRLLFYTVSSFI